MFQSARSLFSNNNFSTFANIKQSVEQFDYDYRGLMNKYRKGEVFASDTCDISQMLLTDVEWQYRYNPFGEREQKRMHYYNGYQNSLPWEYYLLGINKEQLVVYNGLQATSGSEPSMVSIFPNEFNVYGMNSEIPISYKLDKNKIWKKNYKIYDHLGSVRTAVNSDGLLSVRYDYAPFGEKVEQNDKPWVNVSRLSFIGKQKDFEVYPSSLADHGVRKYSDATGSFTSVDPLFEKYYGWSPYQYCGNNPVNYLDRDGRDVLVAFSGANFSGGQDNSTAGKIVSNLTNYAKENNIPDFKAKAFSTQAYPTDFKTDNAMQFINENLKDGEKLIIYGYSAGGVAAQSLSKALNEKNIKVDLLITVDAAFAWGSSSINREIPGNVIMNLNFFNNTPSFLSRSVGGKNITNSKNTIIKNIKKDSSHSDIDEETQKQVENEIKGTVND